MSFVLAALAIALLVETYRSRRRSRRLAEENERMRLLLENYNFSFRSTPGTVESITRSVRAVLACELPVGVTAHANITVKTPVREVAFRVEVP